MFIVSSPSPSPSPFPLRRFGHGASAQRGFTLLLGTGLLLLAALSIVYLFNVGQVVSAKLRLNSAADAAAFSAAVWRARVLNFQAYANRAIVAQEVAVAQAVTLASWARYFETMRAHARPQLAAGYPALGPLLQVDPAAATQARDAAERAAALEVWLRAAPGRGYKSLLLSSQQALNHSAGTFGLGALANEVARANDRRFFAFALTDDGAFEALSQRYASDDMRRRLVDLVFDSLDRFTLEPRSVDRALVTPDECTGAPAQDNRQRYRKRGGTLLREDLGGWEAADTGSIHAWSRAAQPGDGAGSTGEDTGVAGEPADGTCADRERPPVGWGAMTAGPPGTTMLLRADPGDVSDNPAAARRARRALAEFPADPAPLYDGIAAVRELAPAALDQREPVRSPLAVLVRLESRDLGTTSMPGIAQHAVPLSRRVWSLAAAEVFFRRPAIQGARIELASLYSPFWQARLVAPTETQRRAAQAYVD